jgi:hypothetical protein
MQASYGNLHLSQEMAIRFPWEKLRDVVWVSISLLPVGLKSDSNHSELSAELLNPGCTLNSGEFPNLLAPAMPSQAPATPRGCETMPRPHPVHNPDQLN